MTGATARNVRDGSRNTLGNWLDVAVIGVLRAAGLSNRAISEP